MVCICSCNKCEKLHIVRHIPTDICFGVGSTCIKRFMPELYGEFSKTKNGDICINCNITLWYKKLQNMIEILLKMMENIVLIVLK